MKMRTLHIYMRMFAYISIYVYMCIIYVSIYVYIYRVAKTHRIPYLYRSFSAKETYIEWLFCGK